MPRSLGPMSHNGTVFNIEDNWSFDDVYVVDLCLLYRLRTMVKTALSFGRDSAFALVIGRDASDRTDGAIPRQPGWNGDGADNQGRICLSKVAGTGSQTTRPPISATRKIDPGRFLLGGDFFETVFPHFLDQGRAFQREQACCLGNDPFGMDKGHLYTLQFHPFNLCLQIDRRTE